MFYDDYSTLFNPRGKKAAAPLDADAAARRLLAAAGGVSLSASEVSRVVARAMVAPTPTAAPRTGRVAADKRDTVGAKALTPQTLRSFLANAVVGKGKPTLVLGLGSAPDYGVWVGVTYRGYNGESIVVARLPDTSFPALNRRDLAVVRGYDSMTFALERLKGAKDFSGFTALFTEEAPARAQEAWNALRTAWSDSAAWTKVPLSRAASGAATFAESSKDDRYQLSRVLWDSVAPSVQMGADQRLVRPLAQYEGAFVATDGSRMGIIGVRSAPGSRPVQIPRAMLDYCDPGEAWGWGEEHAVAIGPFLARGQYADFPDYRNVLPTGGFGVTVRFRPADLEALRVPAKVSLGGLDNDALTRHAVFYTDEGRDADTLRFAVRFVPKGGDTHDMAAFPPRLVGTFPALALDERKTRRDNGFAPHRFQARYVSEAAESILAENEDAYFLLGTAMELGPAALVTASQAHILMPFRTEAKEVRDVFLAAERGGVAAVESAAVAGDFSDYPVGTVTVSTTGAAYKALVSAVWANTYARYRYGLAVLPVIGPAGPETWLCFNSAGAVIRLPGSLVSKSYEANDASKTDALLAQITRSPTLPKALSPGNMPDLDAEAVKTAIQPWQDDTLALPERTFAFYDGDARALLTVLDTSERMPNAFVLPDGTVFSTDGTRAFIAPNALSGLSRARVGGGSITLPHAVLHEIAQGVEEVTLGDTVVAAGRVLARRRYEQAPDILSVLNNTTTLGVVTFAVADTLKALAGAMKRNDTRTVTSTAGPYVIFDKDGYDRVAVYASIKVDDKRERVYLRSPVTEVQYDDNVTGKTALRLDFFVDALKAAGSTHVNVSLSGNLAPVFVRASPAGGGASYSIIMPVRLD